jgi:hypothetical protein
MTTTFKALANLSRRVAARFHRLFNRLIRKAEIHLRRHRCHPALPQDGGPLQEGLRKTRQRQPSAPAAPPQRLAG